ncbi:uncharacterized protein LOC127264284 [Andrographis paniculata]|uniref:uncharacterized protein LOC127264284 n=1 Tax=Andrographis paniculata TaxID=175694 RepID=UPI0021E764A2|nr:uncharacterized protein LOC127264284 [Andrographis paniculata]XP_051149683.1 uncharacterized protein LOC127264284 [Andrographis paniculata]XP_051149684.1 uncharacterized protein LOC127264284 [Andrographis paniculata]
MKRVGLLWFFIAFMTIWSSYSIQVTATSSNPDLANSLGRKIALAISASQSRELKENGKIRWNKMEVEDLKLEDYNDVNPVPVPSSTASIRPGPIQHGSPQFPYIPGPPPPSSP